MQQTPNPAAQFPWAEPLLAEHSDEVKHVLEIVSILKNFINLSLDPFLDYVKHLSFVRKLDNAE